MPALTHDLDRVDEHTVTPQTGATEPGLPRVAVSLLTGGQDRHYAFGLATALAERGAAVEVLGSDAEDCPEFHCSAGLRFTRLYGERRPGGRLRRFAHVLAVYARLVGYTLSTQPRVFHILWNYRLPLVDRTLLMLLFRLRGHHVALTAHNVNAGRRDGHDTWLNRGTLQMQYRLADRIFVHTERMKDELVSQFHVPPNRITLVPYGVNNAVPDIGRSPQEARRRLGLDEGARVLLCFGAMKPYKGIEYLIRAFAQLAPADPGLRLVLAGERKKGSEAYLDAIERAIDSSAVQTQIVRNFGFIPDEEIELYFRAADVAVLPYTEIFQSGILFLAYSFGLPVIATDVGSFREHVVERETGFVCAPRDPRALERAIERYFTSELYHELAARRPAIQQYVRERHSWKTVATLTMAGYAAGGRLN